MFTTTLPSINRHTITAEEHKRLKRRLFTLRCQYTGLLRTIRAKGATEVRRQRAERLERRIAKIELQLAFSDIAEQAEEPLNWRDLANAVRTVARRAVRVLTIWWTAVQQYFAVRNHTPQHHGTL